MVKSLVKNIGMRSQEQARQMQDPEKSSQTVTKVLAFPQCSGLQAMHQGKAHGVWSLAQASFLITSSLKYPMPTSRITLYCFHAAVSSLCILFHTYNTEDKSGVSRQGHSIGIPCLLRIGNTDGPSRGHYYGPFLPESQDR